MLAYCEFFIIFRRPLAYSTLADLVHHVRTSLPLSDLALAVNLFSKNVHDESLPSSIQTMSCKLLLNLVECIRAKGDSEDGNGRELLMRMFEVFVLKFKSIAEIQMPLLLQKCKQNETSKTAANNAVVSTAPGATPSQTTDMKPPSNASTDTLKEDIKNVAFPFDKEKEPENKVCVLDFLRRFICIMKQNI